VALVLGIGNRLEIIRVAPRPSDVFGRAAALRGKEAGIGERRLRRGMSFDLDRVLPAVAEVIKIVEGFGASPVRELGEGSPGGRKRVVAGRPVWIGEAPRHATEAELVEVVILPAHGDLNDEMQIIKGNGEWHLDPPQDFGFDLVERDL
jgi:hypothetical protein